MGKVIYLDKSKRPPKPESSPVKTNTIIVDGKKMKPYEWKEWCRQIDWRTFDN